MKILLAPALLLLLSACSEPNDDDGYGTPNLSDEDKAWLLRMPSGFESLGNNDLQEQFIRDRGLNDD